MGYPAAAPSPLSISQAARPSVDVKARLLGTQELATPSSHPESKPHSKP